MPALLGRDGPIWFQVLDRFGFPTFVALIVLGMLIVFARTAREDSKAERSAFVGALNQNSEALNRVVESLHEVERGLQQSNRESQQQSFELKLLRETLTERRR